MANLKTIVSTVAPFIGSLLGGPFGAAAGKLLSHALTGQENTTDAGLEKALAYATPEQLAELKRIDADYQTKMAQLGIDEQKIAALDRDSARQREIAVKDSIPALLAVLLTVGFFSILLLMMFYPIQPSSKDVLDVMLGALGTAWISSITYYFGSSYGSQIKTRLLKN